MSTDLYQRDSTEKDLKMQNIVWINNYSEKKVKHQLYSIKPDHIFLLV